MPAEHPVREALHEATHRIPGVPPHVEHPSGHHGRAFQNRSAAPAPQEKAQSHQPHKSHRSLNHSPSRPPRVFVGWQRRIAQFFGEQL